MTNERQHPDSAAETDETVSATYRELSREGAPNHLNDKVLQQAARHARRPRYSRSIVWTRPLAWAATVGLCLAIVLEVTRVPAPEEVQAPVQAPVRQQPETLKDIKSQPGRSTAKQAAKESKSEVRRRETTYDAEAGFSSVEESVVSVKVEFEMQDADECSVEVRADPVKWLACIADLEESGDVEATLRQREALREAFPQFEMP